MTNACWSKKTVLLLSQMTEYRLMPPLIQSSSVCNFINVNSTVVEQLTYLCQWHQSLHPPTNQSPHTEWHSLCKGSNGTWEHFIMFFIGSMQGKRKLGKMCFRWLQLSSTWTFHFRISPPLPLFWICCVAVGICAHSAIAALVRSGTDIEWRGLGLSLYSSSS